VILISIWIFLNYGNIFVELLWKYICSNFIIGIMSAVIGYNHTNTDILQSRDNNIATGYYACGYLIQQASLLRITLQKIPYDNLAEWICERSKRERLLSSDEIQVAVLTRHKRIYSKLVDMLGVKCDLFNRKLKEYLFMECPYYL
jgi:hypothetical protein